MALVTIPSESRELRDAAEIRAFLEPFGICFEQWPVAGRVTETSTNDEILTAYAPEIERLKVAGNFVTADVINVNPETPNLDTMLNKFNKEHTHSEDEVRFTIRGQGVFHIHPPTGPIFGITVQGGDLISVPAGTLHWFDLCQDRHIQCIRLFQDMSGWTPHYSGSDVAAEYAPVCFGPNYVGSDHGPLNRVVQV
jgi:1,2-dihydroxy-3-keto-5-methylthiopentene dioxygenase